MNWFVLLVCLPGLLLGRVLGFLTGKSVSAPGWQILVVSIAVYGGIAVLLLR